MTIYLCDNIEVKLTGRIAEKEVGKEGSRRGVRTDTQHEITPADNEEGTWTKWVRLSDLYEIK